jgi:hypothetical protein
MTPADIRDARATLGQMWGYGRPLKASELGRALRLKAREPGETIRDWERGHSEITGPASVAIEAFLAGFRL